MLPDSTTNLWSPAETSTHQDHVIAHVIGATVRGYFVHDESLHLLLDMGFIWTVYLDGQMVLLPQVMALNELEVSSDLKSELNREVEMLDRRLGDAAAFRHLTVAPVECLITEVSFWENDDRRRLILGGERDSLVIETSLATAEITVSVG